MRWPWTSGDSNASGDDSISPKKSKHKPLQWGDLMYAWDWEHYTSPQAVIPTVLLTTTTLFLIHIYRLYLRRIPDTANIHPQLFRTRSLLGKVTSVGDGDNFRLFHTPGGRLAGWGWLPWRRVPTKKEDLREKTIHIRLAGVDAPELAHFGRPAQPYSQEALDWLKSYILNRRVRAYILKRDQYDRVVSAVYIRRWLLRRDVGYQMLKQGFAVVYEAKSGAEFGVSGDLEGKYRRAEWWARTKKKGMWAHGGNLESPGEYKARMKDSEVQKGK